MQTIQNYPVCWDIRRLYFQTRKRMKKKLLEEETIMNLSSEVFWKCIFKFVNISDWILMKILGCMPELYSNGLNFQNCLAETQRAKFCVQLLKGIIFMKEGIKIHKANDNYQPN